MNCPHCGKPVHDHPVMNAKAKILAILRKARFPLHAGQIASHVYGADTRRNRNRVTAHIWHLNRPHKRIRSDGVGSAAKGYKMARVA